MKRDARRNGPGVAGAVGSPMGWIGRIGRRFDPATLLQELPKSSLRSATSALWVGLTAERVCVCVGVSQSKPLRSDSVEVLNAAPLSLVSSPSSVPTPAPTSCPVAALGLLDEENEIFWSNYRFSLIGKVNGQI